MDVHRSDEHGSGSNSGGVTSDRQRRRQQVQHNQQNCSVADVASIAAPADTDHAASFPEGGTPIGNAKDGWAHNEQPPMTGACKVDYCQTCGMPFEYCEFSGAACAKQEEEKEDGAGQAATIQRQEHEQQLCDELQEKAAISDARRGAGKKDGNKSKLVTVQKQAKRRGKCATNIWGLEHFGVKQEVAAKLASKHFACGSCFQKGQPGQIPFVEIQGDVEQALPAFLSKNFDIPEEKIIFLAEK